MTSQQLQDWADRNLQEQLLKHCDEAGKEYIRRTMTMFMYCLVEEYGFAEKRLNKLIKRFNDETKALGNRFLEFKFEDMIQVLEDKGIEYNKMFKELI